jgi:hypothetical protein
LAFKAGLLASLLCVGAYSQSYKPFPGQTVDQRTRSIQERVEVVYASGNLERALLIYEKELAPIGDKYAQYMVGYMHLNGESVPVDRVEALAWYRLAAERGTVPLVQTRDELTMTLTAAELARSDKIFVDLWKRIGDRALILELIQKDMNMLRSQTGTRIPGSNTSTPTLVLRPSGEPLAPNYYRDIRRRLEARIDYLDTKVEISDDVLVEELEKIRSAEAEVKQQLTAMENR